MGLHHKSLPLLRRQTVRCTNTAVLTANAFSAQNDRACVHFIAEQATIVCILRWWWGVVTRMKKYIFMWGIPTGHKSHCQFNLLVNFARTLIIFRCYRSGTPDTALYSVQPLGTVTPPLSCLCSLRGISLYARATCKTFSPNIPFAF
jgi:hypothetical protein